MLRLLWLQNPPAIPVGNFTAHSLKSTLLSYLHELPHDIGDNRNAHDHHRRSSKELYSRGDVFCQRQLREAVHSGLRPCTPQHRGAQPRYRRSLLRSRLSPKPLIPRSGAAFRSHALNLAGPHCAQILYQLRGGGRSGSNTGQPELRRLASIRRGSAS